MKNYMKLTYRVPFKSKFAYIDSSNYLADDIFTIHGLNVKILDEEISNTESDCVVSFCIVSTKNIPLFKECMEHLQRKMEFFDNIDKVYEKLSEVFSMV